MWNEMTSGIYLKYFSKERREAEESCPHRGISACHAPATQGLTTAPGSRWERRDCLGLGPAEHARNFRIWNVTLPAWGTQLGRDHEARGAQDHELWHSFRQL